MGADFAYTLDGGELGCFEMETFSADYLNAENNITGLNITASDSMMALTMTTDDLIVNADAMLKGNTQVSDLEVNNTCRV